jgi:hypothetical protein
MLKPHTASYTSSLGYSVSIVAGNRLCNSEQAKDFIYVGRTQPVVQEVRSGSATSIRTVRVHMETRCDGSIFVLKRRTSNYYLNTQCGIFLKMFIARKFKQKLRTSYETWKFTKFLSSTVFWIRFRPPHTTSLSSTFRWDLLCKNYLISSIRTTCPTHS